MFSVCKRRKLELTEPGLGSCTVVEWHNNDPFPELGPSVGVDTETELITDSCKTPPLVVLGVYNDLNNTCYIVPYEDAKIFMRELLLRDPVIFLANAGFDYYELWSKQLCESCDRDRIVDVLIRAKRNQIEDEGMLTVYSLKDACKHYLKYEMDKHEDEGDASVRLNFKQNTEVTNDQLKYLAIDCLSTWKLGKVLKVTSKDGVDTRGDIVLTHTSNNGFEVDPVVFDFYEKKLKSEKEVYRQQLISFGFPDPDKDSIVPITQIVLSSWKQFQRHWLWDRLKDERYAIREDAPSKNETRRLLLYLINVCSTGNNREEAARTFSAVRASPDSGLKKAEATALDQLLETYDYLGPVDASLKKGIYQVILRRFMENMDKGLDEAMKAVDDIIQENYEWFTPDDGPGPVVYVQNHLAKLQKDYPGLLFDTTETGRLKCSKKDVWKLQDFNIKDPFLEAYTNYYHADKYLSTYLNRDFVGSDNKVHTRFGMVLTSRTSSTSPNIQNLPSRDKVYALKMMYIPPKGTVLVSIDYSFAELVSLAQDCLTEFGESTLADIINADVCPHYFFAGVTKRVITADVDFCKDPNEVKSIQAFLKANVSKDERGVAKCANFG